MTSRHYFYIFFTVLIIGWGAAPASADIFAVTDPDGGILYTNVPQSPMTENGALFMECPEPRSTDAGAPEFETDTGPEEEYSAGEAAYPSAPADGLTSETSGYADPNDPAEGSYAESVKVPAEEEPGDEALPSESNPAYEESSSEPFENADGDHEGIKALYEPGGSRYLTAGGIYHGRGYSPKYRFSGSYSHKRRQKSHPYRHKRYGYRAGKRHGHGYAEQYWNRARQFRRYGHAYKQNADKHSGHGRSRGYYGGKHRGHQEGSPSGYHESKRHRGFNHKYGTRSGHRVFRGHGRGHRK